MFKYLMTWRVSRGLLQFLLLALLCLFSGCGFFVAGGVSEETNTVAGNAPELSDDDLESSSSMDVSVSVDSIGRNPSTVKQMQPVNDLEDFASNTSTDKGAVGPSSQLQPVSAYSNFKGRIISDGTSILNLSLDVNGSARTTSTDAQGVFTYENLPEGTYILYVTAENGSNSDVAFLLRHGAKSSSLLGPIPASTASTINAKDLVAPPAKTVPSETVTMNPSDGSSMPMDTVEFGGFGKADSVVYTDVPVEHYVLSQMPKDVDYGLLCSWDETILSANQTLECKVPEAPDAISVEVVVEIPPFDNNLRLRQNIVGMFGENGNVFSLALINNDCVSSSTFFALFVSDGREFDCSDALISGVAVETGKALSLTAVWDREHLSLYKDGFLIASKVATMNVKKHADVPVVLGDDTVGFKLKSVRMGVKTITAADVLYRYYQKGGAQ